MFARLLARGKADLSASHSGWPGMGRLFDRPIAPTGQAGSQSVKGLKEEERGYPHSPNTYVDREDQLPELTQNEHPLTETSSSTVHERI